MAGASKGSKGSKGSGNCASAICEIEETANRTVTTRFYDIIISATDAAGNVGTKTCSVIVIPDGHYGIAGSKKSSKKGGTKGPKGMQNGGQIQRGVRHLESFGDLSGRNLQLPKKVKKGVNGLPNNEHDPDDLRKEYARSTQRYVISELSLEWDPKLDLTLPNPEIVDVGNGESSKGKTGKAKGSKSGQRSCPISCAGTQGKQGKKKSKGVQNVTNPP